MSASSCSGESDVSESASSGKAGKSESERREPSEDEVLSAELLRKSVVEVMAKSEDGALSFCGSFDGWQCTVLQKERRLIHNVPTKPVALMACWCQRTFRPHEKFMIRILEKYIVCDESILLYKFSFYLILCIASVAAIRRATVLLFP